MSASFDRALKVAAVTVVLAVASMIGGPCRAATTPPPAISAVAPNFGSTAGGTAVTVTGIGFTTTTTVYFGWTPARSTKVLSPTRLQAVAPPHSAGVVDIRVHNLAGYSVGNSGDRFTYAAPSKPVISAVAPNSGSTAGGTAVTVTGIGFTTTTTVYFGWTPARSTKVLSPTRLQAVPPPHAAGTLDIRLHNLSGYSVGSAPDRFTYVTPAWVEAPQPAVGSTGGGRTVTIYGTNLDQVTAVSFGGAPATDLVHQSPYELTVTTPAHVAGSVDIRATSPDGVTYDPRATFRYAPPSSLTWGSPEAADPPHGGISSISCATPTSCALVDYHGYAQTYNGATWGAQTPVNTPSRLLAVSCATVNFCVAVGDKVASIYNGTTWATPVAVDAQTLDAVSCPTTTFCIAADQSGRVLTFDGSVWSAPTAVDNYGIHAVSCPTTTFCAAEDGSRIMTFNGSTWSAPHVVYTSAPSGAIFGLSCASASFCAAVDYGGNAAIYNGTTWTDANPTTIPLIGVSCPTTSFCMATDADGNAYTSNGTTWSAPATVFSSGRDNITLTCASASFCAVDDGLGNVSTYNGSTWSTPTPVDLTDSGQIMSVSCSTPSFCGAADSTGDVLTYNGVAWSQPEQIDPPGPKTTTRPNATMRPFASISCSGSSFCAAIDVAGNVFTYDGTIWSTVGNPLPTPSQSSISCASSTFCMVVDRAGQAVSYNGSTWSAPTTIDSGQNVVGVSCPTTTWCMAIGPIGSTLTYDSGVWSTPTNVGDYMGLSAVSCPTTSFCAATDGAEQALTFDGTSWSAPQVVFSTGPGASISCPTTSFCAATSSQGEVSTLETGTWTAPAAANVDPLSCASSTSCVGVTWLPDGTIRTGS